MKRVIIVPNIGEWIASITTIIYVLITGCLPTSRLGFPPLTALKTLQTSERLIIESTISDFIRTTTTDFILRINSEVRLYETIYKRICYIGFSVIYVLCFSRLCRADRCYGNGFADNNGYLVGVFRFRRFVGQKK